MSQDKKEVESSKLDPAIPYYRHPAFFAPPPPAILNLSVKNEVIEKLLEENKAYKKYIEQLEGEVSYYKGLAGHDPSIK